MNFFDINMPSFQELFNKDPIIVPLDYIDDEEYRLYRNYWGEDVKLTYLMWLIWKGHYYIIKELFDKYDNKQKLKEIINMRIKNKYPVLFIILEYYKDYGYNETQSIEEYENDLQYKIVKLLIDNGANVNDVDLCEGHTIIHSMAIHSKLVYERVLRSVIAAGADVNARCKFDYTPLYNFADRGDMYCPDIKLSIILIEAGANICMCNKVIYPFEIYGGIVEWNNYKNKIFEKERNKLEAKIKKIEEENAKLKLELSLVPGGEVYEEAKNHFYGLVEEKK